MKLGLLYEAVLLCFFFFFVTMHHQNLGRWKQVFDLDTKKKNRAGQNYHATLFLRFRLKKICRSSHCCQWQKYADFRESVGERRNFFRLKFRYKICLILCCFFRHIFKAVASLNKWRQISNNWAYIHNLVRLGFFCNIYDYILYI